MKHHVVLSLLVVLGCAWAAPVEPEGLEQASCTDPSVLGAADLAMDKINKDRTEGYVFSLHKVANAHMMKHGENSIVFYLTMNVLETNCSVLSKAYYKDCEVRDLAYTPVYGQCKVAIFISKVHRVVRLYKYNCVVRPVASVTVTRMCPDCPTYISKDNENINKTVTMSLEKFNNESGLANHFAVLQVTRATAGFAMSMFYQAEYTIQETTCGKSAQKTDNCPLMECEFAHKGFCKGALTTAPNGQEFLSVKCEIYEPEAAEKEKKLHLLGGATDHSHNDTHSHDAGHDHKHGDKHDHKHGHGHNHDHGHGHNNNHGHNHNNNHGHNNNNNHGHNHNNNHGHNNNNNHGHNHDHKHGHNHKHNLSHDHVHDHTKSHSQHDQTHIHGEDDQHHHTHDHHGHSAHRHAHDHSHDHGHGHDHVHAYHAKAQDHSGDFPNQHHQYNHTAGTHTHDHDHELALDHDHKHAHLHEHEHHHHHHEHEHETTPHDHPEGMWREIPPMGAPVTLPAFPDVPAAGPEVGVTLPLKPDPQIPGQTEPTILPFPTKVSAECVPSLEATYLDKLFLEDPEFKPAA